jgi:3-ketosteroid 9alpha-monooxygenase subunit A
MSLHGLSLELTGWFQIGWSDLVAVGEVVPARYFGKDLVVYRGRDGVVRVHDRYCRHLGASLAHGGCVVEGGIQCPFHGWVWSPEGENTSIPYQDRPNRGRRLGTWPLTELNEAIYVWYDPEGGEPAWQLKEALTCTEHAARARFHPAGTTGRSHWTDLRVHPQMVVENTVDPHHFRFVHRTPISPVVLTERVDGAEWQARVGFGNRWSAHAEQGLAYDGDTRNTIDILWQGMGVSANTEQTRDGLRVVAINTTPVEDGRSEIFATYWVERLADAQVDAETYDARIDQVKLSLPDDVRIWNHQIFLDPPALATSEARGFRSMRMWTAQFYPRGSAYRDRYTAGADV